MAAVLSNSKQGAPFSAWEAIDNAFGQAFTIHSPLVAPPDFSDFLPNISRSFGNQDSYHKFLPMPWYKKEMRRDSFSSSVSSFSSEASFDHYRSTQPSRVTPGLPNPTNPINAAKHSKGPKTSSTPQPAPVTRTQTPQPPITAPTSKQKTRTPRVWYSESTGPTQSAIFSLPRIVIGDVHIGYTPGQLEIRWEYTKVKKVQAGEQVVVRQKQKKFAKVLPLREGTPFSQIKANLSGRQLTVTYPK